MTGEKCYISETPEEKMEKNKQTVLEWIIKAKKKGEEDVHRMMVGFNDDAEALASFAKYLNESRTDTEFVRCGYLNRRKTPAFRPGDIRRQMALLKYICRI